MPLLSGIYDSGPIAPVAKIKENLSIYTVGAWEHYNIKFIEGMPPSSQTVAELVTASLATTLAAGGGVNKQIVNILRLNKNELLHLRWMPLDPVEGILWEQAQKGRYESRSMMSRVSQGMVALDPYMAMSTFFIIGIDRDANIQVVNRTNYALPQARFIWWGYRYLLDPYLFKGLSAEDTTKLATGDIEAVRRIIGATTWLPAEGRGS